LRATHQPRTSFGRRCGSVGPTASDQGTPHRSA
jgi:hypothetical protein